MLEDYSAMIKPLRVATVKGRVYVSMSFPERSLV